MEFFDKAIHLAPDNALVRYNRAKLFISMQQYKVRRAYHISPSWPRAGAQFSDMVADHGPSWRAFLRLFGAVAVLRAPLTAGSYRFGAFTRYDAGRVKRRLPARQSLSAIG